MFRYLTALLMLCVTVGWIEADPIKKTPKAEIDKVTKECADRFVKAVLNSNADEGVKYLATPFRGLHGEKLDSLDKMKEEFGRKRPTGFEIVLGEPVELAKLIAVLKKLNQKEIDEDTIKDYGEYLGNDGRIIELTIMLDGTVDLRRHLLIRMKDGKASIVGISSVNRGK